MKIAQVVCVFRPYKGGIGEVAYYYARELAKRNAESHVYTPRYKFSQNKNEIMDDIIVRRHLPVLKCGNAALVPQILKELSGFDIVHLHYPFFGGSEMVYLLKRLKARKVKLVVTYHMDVVGSGIKGKIFSLHTKVFMPLILNAADKVIVSSFDYIVNSDVADVFAENKDKFVEIPFGSDEIFKPKQVNKNDFGFTENDSIILFVGGLDKAHYFKGLDNLLDVLHKMNKSQVKLVIVGSGDMLSYYQGKVKSLHIEDNVVFTGFIEDEKLSDLYNVCDLFVLPSIDKSEAFGLVSVQAMACAKPVVTSDLPGVRSVVQNNINGVIVKPNSQSDLLEKLEIMIGNPQIRNKMGMEGKNMAEKKYNWNNIGEKIMNLYSSI